MNNKRRAIQLLVAVMVVMYVALQQIAAQQARTSYPLYEKGHTNYHEGVLFSTNATGRIFVRDPSSVLEAVNYRTLTNYVALFGGSGGANTGDYVHIFRADTQGLVYAISNHAFLVSGQSLPFGFSVNGNVTVNGDLTTYGNQYHYVTETIYSNVVIWLGTNFIDTVRYTTNIIYDFTEYYSLVSTNIITVASEMIFNNSKLTATNAFWVTAPHFRSIKGTNLLANGVWDFTGATVLGLSPDLVFGNTNASAGLVYTNANVVLIGTNIPPTGLQGNGYTNELGTAGGFYIAVTNGLVEAIAYSPVLYSGGNTGLVSDANWVGVGTNFTGSGTWIYDSPTRSWSFTANFPPSGGSTQAVSIVVVRPTDWVWGRGGSTISNAIAPVWFHQRTAARSVSGLSWVSAVTTAPHGRYMSAEPQFLELAHDWGTNWAFRIWLSASTTSVDTNRFDVRVTAPNGEQWITNNYTVAQANTILPLDVPTNAFSAYMVGSGATNRWVIEMEVWSRAGTSSTVHNVESVLKVIR